jgi:uncharacterized ferredoxin-like protein
MITEEKIRSTTIMDVAAKMLVAARTAPKGRGIDDLSLALVEMPEIIIIADKMKEIAVRSGASFFERDANNILSAECLLLFGTRIKTRGLKVCAHCGFKDCAEKENYPNVPCSFNTGDLGIAMGSAVSVAMDHRIDNRIMYTVGQAVLELGLMGPDVKVIYGIPLSATAKNPFFDRT